MLSSIFDTYNPVKSILYFRILSFNETMESESTTIEVEINIVIENAILNRTGTKYIVSQSNKYIVSKIK